MSGVQVDNSPAVATRSLDISLWKEDDISARTSSEKKRYYRRKSALKDYFTTEEPLDQIALREVRRFHARADIESGDVLIRLHGAGFPESISKQRSPSEAASAPTRST